MKFYETHYEDYCHSAETKNLHPALTQQYDAFPSTLAELDNIILYGPPGCGKYTQMLYLLRRYSPSALKYEKRITAVTDKQSYTYRISDIHYEVDMSLLGCNSKLVWHELFTQIVDIVSMKTEKYGIIVCKNFHCIHNELLDIFYSYLQQYPGTKTILGTAIQIKFILLTEHYSFIPNNVAQRCFLLTVPRPDKQTPVESIGTCKSAFDRAKMAHIMQEVDSAHITNNKELYSFALVPHLHQLPKDHFNIICDAIIEEMEHASTMSVAHFRDAIYDVLIFNLDALECVWYIFSYFVQHDRITDAKMTVLLRQMFEFFKQYGNNYRAFFHLEYILFALICATDDSA